MSVKGNRSDSSDKSNLEKARRLLNETRLYHSKRFDVGLGDRAIQEVEDADGDWLESWGEGDEEVIDPSSSLDHSETIGNKK
jgi:hypothetical protein